MVGGDDPFHYRDDDVAGFRQDAVAGVGHDVASANRLGVGFAHVGTKAADQAEVGLRTQPVPADDRIGGEGRAGDDGGHPHRLGQVVAYGDAMALGAEVGGEGLGAGGVAGPDHDLTDRADRSEGGGQLSRNVAGAHQQQPVRPRRRQEVRGEGS